MTQYEAAEKFPHKEEKIPSGTENMWFLPPEDPPQFKPEKTRWAILAMFILLSATNSMQWVEYTIISNIVVEYYQIPSTLVSWTSMVYMITYVPLILPGSYILDKTFSIKVHIGSSSYHVMVRLYSVHLYNYSKPVRIAVSAPNPISYHRQYHLHNKDTLGMGPGPFDP
ncbi:unnamed protein product [Arctia plantaginis]|uniref:Uncharacterized protein n=1 Tax=Arctia plantaginis TaxID=874455 RepID=A0A8S1A426_ARCPL|nr:unnamed protein product [Arctia plantaginis]